MRARRKKRKKASAQVALDLTYQCGSQMNDLSYSRFMHSLKQADVELNRKVVVNMTANDAAGFAILTELTKRKLA